MAELIHIWSLDGTEDKAEPGNDEVRALQEIVNQLRCALPDPNKLEWLADYFDIMEQLGPTQAQPGLMQIDLRRWADSARRMGAAEEIPWFMEAEGVQ